jgi:hypothetical protein
LFECNKKKSLYSSSKVIKKKIMKKLNLTIITLLFCSFFAVSGVFAQEKEKSPQYDQDLGNSKAKPDERTDDNYSGGKYGDKSLPIDSHVWFLFAAGIAVGCKVLLNKSKLTAAQDI